MHAEHELNCSTAAVRHMTSAQSDIYTNINNYFYDINDVNLLFICGVTMMAKMYPPTPKRVIWKTYFPNFYNYITIL